MARPRPISPLAKDAAALLGARVRVARTERGMTVEDLAGRVGVSPVTMRKVERGDLTVALGIALEAAAIVGVPLFHADPDRRALERRLVDERLALLPKAVRAAREVDDAF